MPDSGHVRAIVCRACAVGKPIEDFRAVSGNRSGHDSICKACRYAATKELRQSPEGRPDYNMRARRNTARCDLRKYGVAEADLERVLAERETGACHACASTEKPLYIDHDHMTSRYRGLLCRGCNLALGNTGDDVDRLMSLAAYLLQSADVLEMAP